MIVRCPHCLQQNSIDDGTLKWCEGDTKTIDCYGCKKRFKIVGYETVEYSVEEIEKEGAV